MIGSIKISDVFHIDPDEIETYEIRISDLPDHITIIEKNRPGGFINQGVYQSYQVDDLVVSSENDFKEYIELSICLIVHGLHDTSTIYENITVHLSD